MTPIQMGRDRECLTPWFPEHKNHALNLLELEEKIEPTDSHMADRLQIQYYFEAVIRKNLEFVREKLRGKTRVNNLLF